MPFGSEVFSSIITHSFPTRALHAFAGDDFDWPSPIGVASMRMQGTYSGSQIRRLYAFQPEITTFFINLKQGE